MITFSILFLSFSIPMVSVAQDYSDRNIFVNHVGFKPNAAKTAIIKGRTAVDFQVINTITSDVAFQGRMKPQKGDFGTFLVGDFSKLATEGNYEVRTADGRSVPFKIANYIYQNALPKQVSNFSSQRCVPAISMMGAELITVNTRTLLAGGTTQAISASIAAPPYLA